MEKVTNVKDFVKAVKKAEKKEVIFFIESNERKGMSSIRLNMLDLISKKSSLNKLGVEEKDEN